MATAEEYSFDKKRDPAPTHYAPDSPTPPTKRPDSVPLPASGTTETPRTDGALIDKLTCSEGGDEECTVYPAEEIVDADFARTLEKELAQAKATIDLAKRINQGHIALLESRQATIAGLEEKMDTLIANGLERQDALEADRDRLKAELEEVNKYLGLRVLIGLGNGTFAAVDRSVKDCITSLRAELHEANFQRKKASEELKLVTDYAEARRRTAEEDKERLDWLEAHYGFATKDYKTPLLRWDDTMFPTTIRSAIDAARTQSQCVPNPATTRPA